MRNVRTISIVLATVVVAVVLSPVIHLIIRALGEPDTLRAVLGDPLTWQLTGRSVLLALSVAAASMLLGTVLAWLTVRPAWPTLLRGTLTVVLGAALAIPSYVLAFAIIAGSAPGGALTAMIGPLVPGDLRPRDHPLLASWIVLVICTYPYVMLSVRGAMLRECGSLEDAAVGLGSTTRGAFIRITLPRLMPAIVWGGMLAALYTLADFGAVSLLGYETLTWGIYSRYDTAFGLDEARALCFVLALLTLALIGGMRLVRPEASGSTAVSPQPQTPLRLGLWTGPAILVIAVPVVLGLIVPIVTILQWLFAREGAAEALVNMGGPARATLTAAIGAALLVALLALPIASMHLGAGDRARVTRTGGAFRAVLTPLTLIGFALPGIVIAIAAVGLALSVDDWFERLLRLPPENRLYQSHMLLLLAYAALFLPEAVGPLRASAARIHPEQLDAANQLSGRPMEDWMRIALPQMAPGLAAGAALVFVTTAKELPATLVLAPLDVQTLATSLWGAMEEAYFADAAAAALLLIVIASAGLAAALAIERIGRVTR